MEVFLQQLINGLTLGSIYGLIAIGYTMVFGIIGMVNFAHGDVFMVGGFIALILFMVFTAWLGARRHPVAGVVLILGMASPACGTGPSSAWPIGRCAAPSASPR